MSMQEAIQTCYSKYATFSGRATRSEYWYFYLLVMVGNMLFNGLASKIGFFGIISLLWTVGNFIPQLAAGVRRLHDINKAGTWILIGLIPIVGWIVLIIWMVRDSDYQDNQFGPATKH